MKMSNSSYKKAVQYLYGLQKYGIKFGLSKTSNIMKAMGNPHHGQKYIHIAGSNGKGSVAAMLESILIRSGLKVGFYSSPHLVRFTERFRINKLEISPGKAEAIIKELRDIINSDQPPTFFEVTTAIALTYFTREETDIAIMEVGMGGRLDATNVINPLVSVITNIALEHQFFLGSRITDIAGEKAGIIKNGVDLVTAVTQPQVIQLIKDICEKKKATFRRIGKDIRYRTSGSGFNYYGLKRRFNGIELGLNGRFQNRNAALALAVIEILETKGFKISSRHITEGLKNTAWPGRMQIMSRNPIIILDGAHNTGAISELTDSIQRDFTYKRLILVIGIMEDKDIRKIFYKIVPSADYVIYTSPDYYRSANPEILMKSASNMGKQGEIVSVISEAIDRAKEIAGPQDMILITGSLFTVGEALTYFDPETFRPDGV